MEAEPLHNLKYTVSWLDGGAVSCKYIRCKSKLGPGYSEVASGQEKAAFAVGRSLFKWARTWLSGRSVLRVPLTPVSACSFFPFNFCWKTLKWGGNAHKLFNTRHTLICIISVSEEAPQAMDKNEARVLKTATPKPRGGERFSSFP